MHGWGKRAAAVVVVIMAVIGLRLGRGSSPAAVAGFGALAILGTLVLTRVGVLLWAKIQRIDLGAYGQGAPFAAASGTGSVGPALPAVNLRVTVVADKIILVAFPGSGAAIDLPTVPLTEVESVIWVSSRTFHRQVADVRLSSRSEDLITLRLTCPGNSGDLEHLRQTLEGLLPVGAMTCEEPAPSRFQPWLLPPSAVGILVVFALLAAAGGRPSGRPGDAVPVSATPTASPTASSSPSLLAESPTASASPPALPAGPAPAGLRGYFPIANSKHLPVTVGRPWGRPCASVSFELGPEMSADLSSDAFVILPEFVNLIPVTIALTSGESHSLYGPNTTDPAGGPWTGQGNFVEFPVSLRETAPDSVWDIADGLVSWKTLPSKDGKHVTFDWVKAQVPSGVGVDDVLARKFLRLMLARSFGLMYSDRPGSGLRRDPRESIDGLSPADIHALQVFSGCGAPPRPAPVTGPPPSGGG